MICDLCRKPKDELEQRADFPATSSGRAPMLCAECLSTRPRMVDVALRPAISPFDAHKASDVDRAVLADWWEENGQPNVAAFYRAPRRTLLGSLLVEALCRGVMRAVDMKRFVWTLSNGPDLGHDVGGHWSTNLYNRRGMAVLARFFVKVDGGYRLKNKVLDFNVRH